MAQELKLKVKGLYLHPNPLSEAPPGALALADNIVIDRESIAESRRGFKRYGEQVDSGTTDRVKAMVSFNNKIIVHRLDTLYYDKDGDGSVWETYTGTYNAPSSSYTMRFLDVNQSLYFTTSEGIKKLEAVGSEPVDAGMVRALDHYGTPSLPGISGYLPVDHIIAYRIVWGITDANGYKILGSPSNRLLVTNTGLVTSDVLLTYKIPVGITENHFYQIYRSPSLDSALGEEPSDELQLVIEDNPSAVELIDGTFSVTDSTPNSLVGAYLYTSETQEGALQTNEQPPLAKDMTYFKESVFYANTKLRQTLNTTLLVPAEFTGGGRSITIGGLNYFDSLIVTPGNGSFYAYTIFTPAENIAETAKELVRAINDHASNTTINAYYVSGANDLPGRIRLEERGIGGSAFTAYTTGMAANSFSPPFATATPGTSSEAEERVNRIYLSKFRQPGSVPPLQFLDCGSANQPIQRIIALRDAVFVFKKDGIFRIAGDDVSSFVVRRFDDTVTLVAPDSAVVFDNKIYMYSDQGIVSVSDSGVQVMSRPIEKTLLEYTELSNFEANTFGIGYESDRKYIVYTISSEIDTLPTQAFIYNTATDSWTRWTKPACSGIVNPADNKLYLSYNIVDGASFASVMYQERKDYTLDDYADEDVAVTITAVNGLEITLSDVTVCTVGHTLRQGTNFTRIDSIAVNGAGPDGVITVVDELPFTAAGAAVFQPIELTLEYLPIIGQNPGLLKHFQEITLFFSDASFQFIEVGFASNFDPTFSYVRLPAVLYRPWGDFGWGDAPWGGNVGGFQPIRTYVDKYSSRASWLYVRLRLQEAFRNLKFDGLSIIFNPVSPRFR